MACTLLDVACCALRHVSPTDAAMALLVLFLCRAAMQRLTSRGPMLWPVLGIVPTLFAHLDDVHDWMAAALGRAGGTFRFRGVWLGRCSGVVTAVPANVEHILKTNFGNYPKGRYYRERFAELLGDGIFNADGEAWRAQRRAATPEMHSARFAEFSTDTIEQLVHGKLIPLLGRLPAGAAVDLQDILLRLTFDNICAAAFGVDTGCLVDGLPDVPFARAFEHATELSLARFTVPPLVWKSMRLLGVGPERRLAAAVRTVHGFAERTVSERRAELRKVGNLATRSDLLSRLMELDSGCYSDTFLKDFCISFILAGRDTSSVGLAWFFWLLADHPDVEARILAELAAAPAGGRAKRLEYLHAALSEALRLYPPVPIDFKEALNDDVLPDGTAVRRGERVLYCPYAMARSRAVWGDDCALFRPERWLRGGAFIGDSPFRYAVFNAGPRLCIGKRFAFAQMAAVAAAVLATFHVEVVAGQEVRPKMSTTLYMRHGLVVRFTRRTSVQ